MVVGRAGLVFGVFLAFAACGGDTDGGDGGGGGTGGSGTGGTAPNTCPPTLVNLGSGPGILCDEPVGTTCADTEQFCRCGEETIEGKPWQCVPTSEGCPSTMRQGEPCNANHPEACEYLDAAARWSCTCVSNAWSCAPSPCPYSYPGDGGRCENEPGQECIFFRPGDLAHPEYATNVTCTCTADQSWSCD